MEPVLKVENLKVSFTLEEQTIQALKGISFHVNSGEIVALVGESGSGKSVTCYSILKLLPKYAHIEGKILFRLENSYVDLLSFKKMQKIRGNYISMVFQEPSAVLNPLLRIGEQIVETILAHKDISLEKAKKIAVEVMKKVKIPEPERRFYQYPHELSGGLKQRVAIAIAIVNNPKVLLADEPTTALDVTVSTQILNLFLELKRDLNIGILLITHDLGIVAEVADRVIVLYKGEIVEEADVFQIFDNPSHPYTKKLLSSRPVLKLD
ncbi:MAG: ABC transporter ATP-binding protein [Aquificae bacterium]|nr:ABC transporter ATP-binding protein [Aquificota bacterium]